MRTRTCRDTGGATPGTRTRGREVSVIVPPRRPAGRGAVAVLLGLLAATTGAAQEASSQEASGQEASGQETSAHEPLFLRIRPQADSVAAEIRAARAAREAVWERSSARARLAIASVCTGCIPAPERRPREPPDPLQPATASAPPDPVTRPEAASAGRLAATEIERGEP
jgi:hypothetical protein